MKKSFDYLNSCDCQYNGRTYVKHTIWQPGPCTVCNCEDPIILCETIRCSDPLCDYDKGEYLQISADSCCPDCAVKRASCTYQDKQIPHNMEWNPEPCMQCICKDGEVQCSKLPCPATRCRSGEIIQTLPGKCCPQCVPAGRQCSHDGVTYPDGSDWSPMPCTTCVCKDGQHSCYPQRCPTVVCAKNEVLEVLPGTCCPVCQGHNTTCRDAGREYKTGEQWNRAPCTLCVCIGGTIVCTTKECMEPLACSRNTVAVRREGECCSECVPIKGECNQVSPKRYHGDIWNTSNCDYCMCMDGAVKCHTAVCEKIVCFKEEVLVHHPGICCPQCIVPATCEYDGQVHRDQDRWFPEPCSVCYCDAGTTTCYTQQCPVCQPGTVAVPVPGECCGSCRPVRCSPQCSSCEPSAPDNCTVCTNTQLYVQDGRCLHTCRLGFFPSPAQVCEACHDTCYTCQGGTQFHCTMCQPGLMWKQGQCVAQCGAGYYLQNGKCLACHASCKGCNGPRLDQCITCTIPAQVVFHGTCLDQCPENFFVRAGKCIACHPTCKTCTPDGAGCASCWQGGLLHLGQCTTRCSVGYYHNTEGSCSPCHPSCEACSGSSNKNCTSCHAGFRLTKKGKCRNQCDSGQFMNVAGECQDCAGRCSECYETWGGDKTVCSGCTQKGYLPLVNQCVNKCPTGHYQENKACKACGKKCVSCTSPTTCTRCIPSSLLYKGLCVSQCDQGQFEHGPSLTCQDCSANCLKCYSGEDCSVCDSTTYLKQGRCVSNCGEGFMPVLSSRECTRNTQPPVFQILRHVQVTTGGVAPLESSMFYVTDPDTPLEMLQVTVVTEPNTGFLLVARQGKDEELISGMSVPLTDVLEGKVRFLHNLDMPDKGRAILKVTDSQLSSPTQTLYFQAVTRTAISLETRSLLIAKANSVTYLQSSVLNLLTKNTADTVRITVLEGPKNGQLYNSKMSATVRMFTLQDLRDAVVGYRHNQGGATGPDWMLLQATDGFHLLSFLFNIEVRQEVNSGPVLLTNKVAHVVVGDMLQISHDLLHAKILDKETQLREEVVYTLVPPMNNPSEGEIMMVVPIPRSGVGHGWEDLGDGNMAARMSRFLQRDIDEGRIWYKNKGMASLTDIVKFEVADTAHPSKILTDQSFVITVRDKTNTQPVAHPTLAAGVRLGIKASEDQLIPIPKSSLAFEDRDTADDKIVYSVTQPLGLQDGRLEHIERPFFSLQTFTQDDINNNRVIYRPPEKEIGPRNKEVHFFFTVTDDQQHHPSEEHKYSILVTPVNNKPPRFISPDAVLHVSQGGYVPIGQSVLSITDEDTPLTEISLTLLKEPAHGVLEKVKNGLKVTLRKGDTFTYREVLENGFQYQHDKSASLSDMMQLSATDGRHNIRTTLTVQVIKVDKSSPFMLPSASCHLVITEGSDRVVDRDILAFGDHDDMDDKLNIYLSTQTVHGKLLLDRHQVMQGDKFTQADINIGRLSFMADSEIGADPVTEVVIFNVTDASGNLLPSQPLTIYIQPDNNQSPRVTVAQSAKVDEGSQVTLTSDDIIVSDPDSSLDDLIVVIETQPGFGVIKDMAPASGSEKLEDRLVSSFPVTDLQSGYVMYVQAEYQGQEPVRDSFVFHITDGTNQSPAYRFNFDIKDVNDEAPTVVTEQVFVQEGHSVVLTNASIYVMDLDTPSDHLVFTLNGPPLSGVIQKKSHPRQHPSGAMTLEKGATFTYQDITQELLMYSHDDTEASMDTFSLNLTDGRFNNTLRISVIIGLVSDEAPRVTINRGLRVSAGSVTVIKKTILQATDVDSDDPKLTFIMTRDPKIGTVYLMQQGRKVTVASDGTVNSFTQAEIDAGLVQYQHSRGETTGNIVFKFTVADPEGNQLIDQNFYITILEDRLPPRQLSNKECLVEEGGHVTITTDYLSFTDDDSEASSLVYRLVDLPKLGHLELTTHPGIRVAEFTQADLAANNILYIHTSDSEVYTDSFTFSVSDGTNMVKKTFSLNISPVDDSLPVVTNMGLQVQEGVRKLITSFDLSAMDPDTKEESVVFRVTSQPSHGSIEHLVNSEWRTTSSFSMTEIYENHVSYQHDGSESTADSFKFVVSDNTNRQFLLKVDDDKTSSPTSDQQTFSISVLALDDGSPILETNIGLHFLEMSGPKPANILTPLQLLAVDRDTRPDALKFVIRRAPQFGRLQRVDRPGVNLTSFTQGDINNSVVQYVLTKRGRSFQDSFTFDLYDSKPNRIPGNVFHITWSSVSFEQSLLNVTETAGVIRVPVKRYGNLKQYSIVTCRTVSGTATSSDQGSRPGQQDFVQHMGQVQFDEWQDTKECTIIINDDSIFEGPETFYVELIEPNFTLLGPVVKTTVTIIDLEDEPVLQFKEIVYNVNESDSYLSAAIVRSGDISSTVSTICFTSTLTARGSPLDRLDSGSDYISRGNSNSYRVVFPSGVTQATCDVKLIDDSVQEASEQFELELSAPSYGAKLGINSRATVIIDGPNDESLIFFAKSEYYFLENAGTVDLEIIRQGTDLSHSSTVWCATRLSTPPSAASGQDYVPSSSQITFGPGQTSQRCQVNLLDDDLDPKVEGNETFSVFLRSAISSTLAQPYIATVVIGDTSLDVSSLSFESDHYIVDEGNKTLHVAVMRSGDSTYQSSVICYTRQDTAKVDDDYEERTFTVQSRIVFKPGEKVKNCSVAIIDDDDYEEEETFYLKLAQPLGSNGLEAVLGEINVTRINVTNNDDVPKLQFEKSAYSIQEPGTKDQIAKVTVKVIRTGDVSKAATVRVSTRDGSAFSGTDYNPRSQMIQFIQGVREMNFPIDILYNNDIEWHETFSVILGPGEPVGAQLGSVAKATITILDNDVSGSLVLPASPVVVSLLLYDDVETGINIDPSPGYPLVCVTPCDSHHPSYHLTHHLCDDAKINQSSIYYRWEVAMPEDLGSRPPFMELSYNTLYTSINSMTLDSLYFRPSFHIRCIAQPLDDKGNPGVPLKSLPVTIGRDNGVCKGPVFSSLAYSYQAQSFMASLEYVSTEDPVHPNTIHINIQVPHQDGMLPLVSTFPIHNLKFVLSEPVYRQQHLCSNLITPAERASLLDSGFLDVSKDYPSNSEPGFDFPYQFNNTLRENKTLLLYKHLNLKTCVWTFDAWYHMTDLVDLCGGRAVSDFQISNGGKTYLTVRVPLYVSYLYATAPIGWGALEHRTEMEFSFYYDTVLWKSGLQTEGELGGKIEVMRILIQEDGRLSIDVKTQAKFRGMFVLQHHTLPGYTSRMVAPDNDITFDLDLIWGQNTFDGPFQLWRATSDYSIKDYTGEYTIELIPCTVQPTQGYTSNTPLPCAAQLPLRFNIPISFQQTNRPVPLEFTLNTHFQLSNNERMFLKNPFKTDVELDEMDQNVAFSKGDKIFGRVLWSPEQDLKDAYNLALEKVFICAGRNGYIPTYDPAGTVYNNGPQFGCIQPRPNLRHRFLILDRGAPHVTTKHFQNVPFDAAFASENPLYSSMIMSLHGVDGFILSVDPLFKVTAGFSWYLQVIYSIGPSDPNLQHYRNRRSAVYSLVDVNGQGSKMKNIDSSTASWLESNSSKNGTNIIVLNLNSSEVAQPVKGDLGTNTAAVAVPVTVVIIILIVVFVLFVVLYRRKRRRRDRVPAKQNNLEIASQNSVIYKGKQNNSSCSIRSGASLELKQTVVQKGDRGKPLVRVKNTNIQTDRNISKGNGTEV